MNDRGTKAKKLCCSLALHESSREMRCIGDAGCMIGTQRIDIASLGNITQHVPGNKPAWTYATRNGTRSILDDTRYSILIKERNATTWTRSTDMARWIFRRSLTALTRKSANRMTWQWLATSSTELISWFNIITLMMGFYNKITNNETYSRT